MSLPPFTYQEIEERFDDMFVEVSEPLIEYLTRFDIETQDALLELVQKAASTNSGLAYQLTLRLQKATELMELDTIALWLDQAIDAFDDKGIYAAVEKLDELENVAQHESQKLTGIAFEEVSIMLEHFVTGLHGRSLNLDTGRITSTDTETLYLPGMLNVFSDKDDNFQLYKCIVVHLWAQNWFGTWRRDLHNILQGYQHYEHALEWFQLLELMRINQKIRQELPGIYRQSQRLCKMAGFTLLEQLDLGGIEAEITAGCQLQDTLDRLDQLYHQSPPPLNYYTGQMQPEQVEQIRQARMLREKDQFRSAIAHMLEEKKGKTAQQLSEEEKQSITAQPVVNETMPEGFSYQLLLDGDPLEPPEGVDSLMASIIQDLGEIPSDYLVAAGDGHYHVSPAEKNDDDGNVWSGTYHEEGATLHREWDCRRQRYKKNWCALREVKISSGNTRFVDETLSKYAGLVKNLRRTFEVLRGEDKILRKQPYGDDIDIDALVETWADTHCGMEMSDNIFTKMHKEERNIAVIFMVDMSGSTKGWINDAEREAVVLLCEALETLGDRYAIYGFTGNTRKRCEIYPVKTFEDPYDKKVRGRIANISPKDYTRMGVYIRHFNQLFESIEARTKLLITLSDGKPEDYDGYRGEYGIEDTRMALLESRQQGIHPFCITIDREGRDYLKTMYGQARYVVIDDVRQLPLKVADIYRHITS